MHSATIQSTIDSSLEKVWKYWTQSEHITQWNFASDERHCPDAVNEFEIWKYFSYTMAAKDGSMSFAFSGKYTGIEPMQRIEFTLWEIQDDTFVDWWRKVVVNFEKTDNWILITETFDAEDSNTLEQQKQWRQAILENFRKYVENSD